MKLTGVFLVFITLAFPVGVKAQTNFCMGVSIATKCVDAANTMGWPGADAGAWINAADAAVTNGEGPGVPGTVQVYGVVTATTQITVGVRHTLDVQGAVLHSLPVLMSDGAHLECHNSRGSPGNTSVDSGFIATAAMPQQVRGLTQDGTTEMFTIDRCGFDGGYFGFTNGQIDTTGMNDRTYVHDVELIHRTAGYGVYIGNAAVNSTSFQEFRNIWDNPVGVACIHITANVSNGSIENIDFYNYECTGSNVAATILVDSPAVETNDVRNITFFNPMLGGGSSADGIKIDGAWQVSIINASCLNGVTNCIHVTNRTNNVGITAYNIIDSTGGGNFVKDDLNNTSVPVDGGHTVLSYYPFYNVNSPVAIQGFDIYRTFLPVTSGNLPTSAPNGTQVYCSNCKVATSPCAGGGTGAMAFKVNGAWRCQ